MNAYQSALYLHFPFCRIKCDYCDFFSQCDFSLQQKYFSSLEKQICELKYNSNIESFKTLYFGGGTPGMADTDMLGSLFDKISRINGGSLPEEVTLECNPSNVSRESIRAWKDRGINRLSLGVQSFQDDFLKRAGRKSSRNAVLNALELLKNDGSLNLNIDLIQGLPGMDKDDQLSDLNEALSFSPDHISWYGLILEEGTVLTEEWDKRSNGKEEEGDEAWDAGCQLLEAQGYKRYEISNFCLPGRESRHNSMYWTMQPYLGCGPAAVSMLPGKEGLPVRFRTKEDLESYAEGKYIYTEEESLPAADFLKDFLLMGLRLADGIDLNRFERIFGVNLTDLIPRTLTHWSDAGLLILDDIRLRASHGGMDLLNTILVDMFTELDGSELSHLSCKYLS